MKNSKLIGKMVYIKSNVENGWFDGDWGHIVEVDDDGMYWIDIFDGDRVLPFERNEFTVPRKQQ